MNNPIALALLINHEARTTFAPDRQQTRRVAPVDSGPSLGARVARQLGLRRTQGVRAAA